ncbi:hypothetical protein ACPX19_04370 [Winogradskyella sp. HB-48]|uniref:hypothetical protein n=1 Tax=Winogradskyella sp. HB-48 TaxID=3416808 RepID=UPI003CE80DAF
MKIKTLLILLVFTSIAFSCRKEETEFIQTPEDEILEANSNIALLIERTTSNDGSIDNIVDRANCFDIAFPYTVTVNGVEIEVGSQEDYAVIECVFDQSDSDSDTLNISFPITIVLNDFSEVTINSLAEFNTYTNSCNGENEADNDIECIDFNYPIEASIFNPNNELLDTETIETDNELFSFIGNLNDNTITTFNFPITVTLSNGSVTTINNFDDLEVAIENTIDSCDEDDDYDYSDDDCNDCTILEIENLLVNCSDWNVNRLKRNAIDYDNAYYNYNFNFFSDGTMSVYWNTTTVYGTWIASGLGNNLEIIIDVPALPLCNNNWILQEIKNCTDTTEVNFIVGDDDRLQYFNNCN